MNNNSYNEFLQELPAIVPNINMHPRDYILNTTPLDKGIIVECGVHSGASITQIANRYPQATVFGFDSFVGLPEAWGRPDMNFGKGAFNLNNVLPSVPANVTLIAGWFDKTLPEFKTTIGDTPIAILHIDCDLYSSTKTVFDCLGANIQSGTVILFDELFNYPTYEKNELLAFYEFIDKKQATYKWIGKNGSVNLNPLKDNGYWDQPAALVIN